MREEVNCSCSVENVPKGPNQTPAISTLHSHQLFIVMISVTLAEASNINDTIQRNLLNSHFGNSATARPAKATVTCKVCLHLCLHASRTLREELRFVWLQESSCFSNCLCRPYFFFFFFCDLNR